MATVEVEDTYRVKWYGPFFNGNIPREHQSGLYLLYVGVYPVYLSYSDLIPISISRHMVISSRSVVPVDMLGREVMHYVNLYKQPLAVKVGKIFPCEAEGSVASPAGSEGIVSGIEGGEGAGDVGEVDEPVIAAVSHFDVKRDKEIYQCVASAIAFQHPISCNRYERLGFEYPVTRVVNVGKHFPLESEIIAVTQAFPPRTPG